MKALYNAILSAVEKNAAQFGILGVNPPETLDIHLGQPQNPDDFEFALPAVFYDYSADFASGYAYVQLYVVQEFGDDTENFSKNKEDGERFLDFITALKRCVINLRATNRAFGKLTLYQEQPQQNDFYYVHLLTLRCTYNADLDDDLLPGVPKEEFALALKKGRLRKGSAAEP